MSRLDDIITNARYTLRDNGDRYTTDKLLSHISDAQRDIAAKTNILRYKIAVSITAGATEYSLPDRSNIINRVVTASGKPIALKTHDQMDIENPGWELDIGTDIEAIIYDNLQKDKIRVYPIQSVDFGDIYIRGYRIPRKIDDLSLSLNIHSKFDLAIKYYVVAMCLADDRREVQRALGSMQYKFYEAQLELAKRFMRINKTNKARLTTYSGS